MSSAARPLQAGVQRPATASRGLRLMRRLLALAVALGVAVAVSRFPMGRPVLGAGLLLYAAALYRFPWAWMLVMPALLPVVDLALWSGRFFFDEFDFLALTSLAVLYWRQADGRILPGIFTRPYLPVTLLALSYALGVAISLYPLPPVDINSFGTYLSPYNALRVAKGFFWAWLLMPFLLREHEQNPRLATQRLIAGIALGLGLAGICVLWERGVFVDLFWGRNIYALLASLLDFTDSYRITGMFSGMNVGDSAIDAYLAMAVPLALYFVIHGKSPRSRLAGLGIFGLGCYGVMVTFSRGLYAAFGLALLIILSAYIFGLRRRLLAHFWEISFFLTAFILATGLLFFLYTSGGYEALTIAIGAVVVSGLTAPRLKTDDKKILVTLLIGGAILIAALIHRAIHHDKWTTTSPGLTLFLAASAGTLLFALPAAAARKRMRGINPSSALITALLMAVFWMVIIPPLSGIQALSRFSTSHEDFATRQNQWRDSLTAMTDDWQHRLLGMGVGSFPRYFMPSQIGKIPLASYRFEQDPSRTYMTLGAGDFTMIQRVSLKPDTIYRLQLDTRTGSDLGGVEIKLCHRNILYSDRWVPDCQTVNLRANTAGRWLTQTIAIKSGILGRYGIFYWPPTLMLANDGKANIQITNISLTGPDGINLIQNGDFADGADHWFLISDFEHLAWHTENIFIHLYFEQGLIGLVFFLLLTAIALNRLRINHQNGDRSAIFCAAGICAFLAVGIFSTSLDMPRVTTLYYLILFAALAPAKGFAREKQV